MDFTHKFGEFHKKIKGWASTMDLGEFAQV